MMRPSFVSTGIINPSSWAVPLDKLPVRNTATRKFGWYIDPWSTNCERLRVKDFDGQALVLNTQPKLSHSANAKVVCLSDRDVTFVLYGAVARFFGSDDWMSCARTVIENRGSVIHCGSPAGYQSHVLVKSLGLVDGTYIKDAGFVQPSQNNQPHSTLPFNSDNAASIVNDYLFYKNAQIRGWGNTCEFQAEADTDVITLSEDIDVTVGQAIAFGNIYNESFPANILTMRLYQIKTFNPTTKGITINEFGNPGATVTWTVDFQGQAYMNSQIPVDIRLDEVQLGLAVQLCQNEKGYMRDCRGGHWILCGKDAEHHQLATGDGAVYLYGEGLSAQYISVNRAPNNVGVTVGPSKNIYVRHMHGEATTTSCIDVLSGAHGFRCDIITRTEGSGPGVRDLVGGSDTSWEAGLIAATGSQPAEINYQGRTYYGHDNNRISGNGITDDASGAGVFHGCIKGIDGIIYLNRAWVTLDGKDMSGVTRIMKLKPSHKGMTYVADPATFGNPTAWECWLPNAQDFATQKWGIFLDRNLPVGVIFNVRDHLGTLIDSFNTKQVRYYKRLNLGGTYSAATHWVVM